MLTCKPLQIPILRAKAEVVKLSQVTKVEVLSVGSRVVHWNDLVLADLTIAPHVADDNVPPKHVGHGAKDHVIAPL